MVVLLHDIGDYKLHDGVDKTREKVTDFLQSLDVEDTFTEKIISIIKEIGFSDNKNRTPSCIEAMIAQDADRLDAIGAIGVARTFQYGGNKGRELYNPEIDPKINSSSEEYKKSTAPTINHFYEKLLLIKNLMNTEKAKRIANQRHDFMLSYLEQFFEEWNGKR